MTMRTVVLGTLTWGVLAGGAWANEADRARAVQLEKDGNFAEAYVLFRGLAVSPGTDPASGPTDLERAVLCLQRLNRLEEADALLEESVAAHAANWRLLHQAAAIYLRGLPHVGFLVGGEFQRGHSRGGPAGRWVNVQDRDRTRALQLLQQALPPALRHRPRTDTGLFFMDFAQAFVQTRRGQQSWRLQTLTDLSLLPDYDEPVGGGSPEGAPVDGDGNPVYYGIPAGWEAAVNDGERWRWLLQQAEQADPALSGRAGLQVAEFLHGQFGVQTLAGFYGRAFGGASEDERAGILAVHTLKDGETITRLAIGIRRFDLPAEHGFIRLFRELAENPDTQVRGTAISRLATIYENRRQYPEAVTWWERYLPHNRRQATERIAQITGNWGRFEPVRNQPAGTPATADFVFRNAARVRFTAHRIDLRKLVADTRAALERQPRQVDWRRLDLGDIGRRLVWEQQSEYVREQVAAWDLALEPRPSHFDRRLTVQTPLTEPGAYLLAAELEKGNTSRIIIMLDDLAIVRRPLDRQHLFLVADAVTGQPLAGATLSFFGYQQEWDQRGRRPRFVTAEKSATTDADGCAILGPDALPEQFAWLTAASLGHRFAFDGFSHIGFPESYEESHHLSRAFCLTDRPVYRPGDTVNWKAWVRTARYDLGNSSEFAGANVGVEIRNPRDEKVLELAAKADAYGGIAGELPLPKDATLGIYTVRLRAGQVEDFGQFRVEEYRKPEYEVTVEAPTEPVMLGETILAKVKAAYFFGAPVTKGTVHVKVVRQTHDERWYPVMPWDWFYGPGYWWFGAEYAWYPGWARWGCPPPPRWWWHGPEAPPEVVLDLEAPIGPDGTVTVPIETLSAQALHGNADHRFEITAEVRDESRRTIVGSGRVLTARQAFNVVTWGDRGHYRGGDTVRASFRAMGVDGRGVPGKATLRLLALDYGPDRLPSETTVETWEVDGDADGHGSVRFTVGRPGQYRLSCTVRDARGREIEGGHLFVVRGPGLDEKHLRFNPIELVPDKTEYRPGDTVELAVNADREGATVLLFIRPVNGVAKPPRVLRLTGRSTVVPIPVTQADMPNFHVEAVTVADARVHVAAREIVVPPETRVLGVEVLPSAPRFRPGDKGALRLRVTDAAGEPFAGSAVIAVYDRSIEYISGGSNVDDIRAFFWKWRRGYAESIAHTLERWFHNALRQGEKAMAAIGVFGTVGTDLGEANAQVEGPAGGMGGPLMRGAKAMPMLALDGAAPMGMAMEGAPAPMAAMAPMADGAVAMAMGMGGGPGEPATPVEATAVIRKDFADTALWVAALNIGADGTADVALPFPDSLTTWRIRVWVMGHGTRVGEGSAEVITSKNLLLRLQAPRFFVQQDEVTLSANIHNYLEGSKQVRAVLELDGKTLETLGAPEQTVRIASQGEARVDWRVRAAREGEAVVRMKAFTDEESDAVEMRFPVFVHGLDKLVAQCGFLRPEEARAEIAVDVPAARRPEATRLELRLSPSLALSMVDALPYLADYPYGCTEQTLNRFLPSVMTQNVLLRLGVSLREIREKRANLNAQELGDPGARARQWQRRDRNPVFDEEELRRMVREGVEALVDMQLGDGGWGWFSGWGERSSAHTTATVVHGLQVAVTNDVQVDPEVIARGVAWLTRHQAEQVRRLRNGAREPKVEPWKTRADHLDALVYRVLADADVLDPRMRDFLYRDRTELSVYALALFGLGLQRQAQTEMLAMVLRNLSQVVVRDDENQTAWLNLGNSGYWWNWYGSEIEAHAAYLKLLCAAEPASDLPPRLVKYLLNNRKHATHWNSTRDTALVIEAFADFIRATGEDRPDMTVTVTGDGRQLHQVRITPETIFSFDNAVLLEGDAVAGGTRRLTIEKTGRGPLYWNCYLSVFTLEDPIAAAGLEVKVERSIFRLQRDDREVDAVGAHGQALRQRAEHYRREPLSASAAWQSGDLIEVELTVESKNDYEYIVIEDRKAAGCEPVDLRSGYTGNELGAYVEYRDARTVFFVQSLPRGRRSVSYRLRAETPGRFSALPAVIQAMYAPELRGNSDEAKLTIGDAPRRP